MLIYLNYLLKPFTNNAQGPVDISKCVAKIRNTAMARLYISLGDIPVDKGNKFKDWTTRNEDEALTDHMFQMKYLTGQRGVMGHRTLSVLGDGNCAYR
jgi:hypothetical protein